MLTLVLPFLAGELQPMAHLVCISITGVKKGGYDYNLQAIMSCVLDERKLMRKRTKFRTISLRQPLLQQLSPIRDTTHNSCCSLGSPSTAFAWVV